MMNDAIEVEINLTTDREKRREEEEKGKEKEPIQPFSSTSLEDWIDRVMEAMESLMERIIMDNNPPPIKNTGK